MNNRDLVSVDEYLFEALLLVVNFVGIDVWNAKAVLKVDGGSARIEDSTDEDLNAIIEATIKAMRNLGKSMEFLILILLLLPMLLPLLLLWLISREFPYLLFVEG